MSLTRQFLKIIFKNDIWYLFINIVYFAVNLTATCPRGYYCPLGSVRPIQCSRGTYQPQVGQSSPGACKPCPDFNLNLSSKPDPFLFDEPAENITDCMTGNSPTEFEGIKNLPSNKVQGYGLNLLSNKVQGYDLIKITWSQRFLTMK